jgi:MFS family permease
MDPRVWKMALARAVNTMGLSLAMTFLGIYVVGTRGYPAWMFGLVALAANLCQSWSNAWAGILSDRIGRRPLITGSLFVRSVVIAALGLQILLDAPLWSLALNMMASGALRGCFEPVAYALVADVARDDQRISAFGLQRMGTNLGWAIGPVLGGSLTLVMPYGAVFFVAAAGMIAAAIVTLTIADPVKSRPATGSEAALTRALGHAARDPAMRLLLAGTFLAALVAMQMFATLSIYLTDELALTKADVGVLYGLNGVGVLLLQLPALAVVRRLGIARILPLSSLIEACGFALVGFAAGLPGAALAIFVITSAEVLFAPAHQTAIAEVADPAHRGRAFGVVGFAQLIGVAIGPLVGGVLLDTIGARHHVVMWALIAGLGAAQAACFTAFVRKRRPPPGVTIAAADVEPAGVESAR